MNNVRRLKRSVHHWRGDTSYRTLCGRKVNPVQIETNMKKVTCKTCRDMLIVNGMLEPAVIKKPAPVVNIENSKRVDIGEIDKLITAGLRAAETEINGAVAQACRALDTSLLPRESGLIIRDLRGALERLLKLIQLLG